MTCPDEDTFARMQAGLLESNELANFHRHLDQCPACLELAGVLVGVYGDTPGRIVEGIAERNVTKSSDPQSADGALSHLAPPSRRSKAAFCAMTLAHAYFGLSIVPVFLRTTQASGPSRLLAGVFGVFSPVVTDYIVMWGFVGFAWACVGCWALLTNRRWAVVVGRGYAVLSLPTIILGPLSLCLLVALQRPRNRSQILGGSQA